MRLTPMLELYHRVCARVSIPYPPLRQLWSFMSLPYIGQTPPAVSTRYVVSTTPSSSATRIEAGLNTEPGSSRSLTAWLCISRYSPSKHFSMFTIALMSPVGTSITMATPTLALISFNSSISERSARSCMLTSMVVTISAPSIGGVSVMFRNLSRTFRRCTMPLVPRRMESYDNSSPNLAVSLAPNMAPMVRPAKEP